LPHTPNLSAIADEGVTEAKTLAEPFRANAAIIADNRPAFSFGQMNQKRVFGARARQWLPAHRKLTLDK